MVTACQIATTAAQTTPTAIERGARRQALKARLRP